MTVSLQVGQTYSVTLLAYSVTAQAYGVRAPAYAVPASTEQVQTTRPPEST